MGFRGHLVSGGALGILAAELGVRCGQISADEPLAKLGVGTAALIAALLPDLDTSSVPQRWFFRVILVALLGLAFRGEFELATGLAIISLLPLLDHHRGWTHGRYAPLLVLPVLALLYALVRAHGAHGTWLQLHDAMEPGLLPVLTATLPYLLAAAAGWYLHLLLDGKLTRHGQGEGHR